jgi:two-component system response regulator RegX3
VQEDLSQLTFADVVIDTRTLNGHKGSQAQVFTRREVDILSYLLQNHERPITREELLHKVWGYGKNLEIETRTVDIHIAKLRRKIESDSKNPSLLVTVRGEGYRLMSAE